ncbi:flagellin lysine-N-methylase [uncultured Clostridium sp.]|jgi:lysine-N-methylase|uniref:flagellin lysine-N-methylase n=1 Tax=uncultured Clostridium sp. TaxID=59620 RepID=UPI002612DB7A|nr:flagellin lysine-N-methylase [uncultured Clostridium sp.]
MSNELNILKTINFDNFKCTADKCKFTCCSGWDVSIDDATHEKWKSDNSASYILDNITFRDSDDESGYFVNKETSTPCPFLDSKGLCEIVKSHGENYLSNTCHSFPRIENTFDETTELSLSCACPEVVEILSALTGKISIPSSSDSDLLQLQVRKTLIDTISNDELDLNYKLMIVYEMLLKLLDMDELSEEAITKVLKQYNDASYIKDVASDYKATKFDIADSIEEFNTFFLDITENYKEVSGLKLSLTDIVNFAENTDSKTLSTNWNEFKELLKEHNTLIENCIISKVISNCTSDDIEDMTNAMQMIILDYLLTRYALFLKYCEGKNKTIDIIDVKDYIVVFSRIIGNNTDAVAQFLEESFDDYILELGYLSFISLY